MYKHLTYITYRSVEIIASAGVMKKHDLGVI